MPISMPSLPSSSFPAAHPLKQCMDFPSAVDATCPAHPSIFGQNYKV